MQDKTQTLSARLQEISTLPTLLEEVMSTWGLGLLAPFLSRLIVVVTLLLIAILAHLLFRRLIVRALLKLVSRTETRWDDALVKHHVFFYLAHLVPGLVLYFGMPLVLTGEEMLPTYLQRGVVTYMILMAGFATSAFLSAVVTIYEASFRGANERPILSYIQVVKVVLWLFVGIMAIATLLDREPWALLGGLGAMTAVLLLVFRDALLGLVASIQLTGNDMVRVGDWIEMPHYGADGDVIEISLTTVKVQNWDKTITTIPSYKLIEDAFKNWRGMSEAGGRRIKRSVLIDLHSIRFADEELLARLRKVEYLREHIATKEVEIAKANTAKDGPGNDRAEQGIDQTLPVNGRRLTNIGLFRAYLAAYLRHHPMIHQDMTFLVRHLAPSEKGLPIEIYVFCKELRWAHYEDIQGDIFDHILAVAPELGLRIMQIPSGGDLRRFGEELAKRDAPVRRSQA